MNSKKRMEMLNDPDDPDEQADKGEKSVRRFQITLSEYNRIYQVVHGVLNDIGYPEKACIFFACFGAMMLNKHFKIRARAVAGGFALCVNETPQVTFFGQIEEGRALISAEGFHMWVQTQSHIIDFMAPIYTEAFAETRANLIIPRKMFQRPFGSEAQSLNDLNSPGDFFTLPDPKLTEALIDDFFSKNSRGDLLMVADQWFGGRRRKQKRSLVIQNDLGEKHQLTLPPTMAAGSW